ncbi:MAG TPA: methyltransferase [Pseudolabrys sp.]|nr:methyltransferase [Pseudolabrys sp.]
MSDWISFYDLRHSLIYVNDRHRDVHYRTIAQDIREYIPSPDAQVMDYGCGEATSAAILADSCAHLTMVEAAPNVRGALNARYGGNAKISVLTPDEAAARAPQSFDLIVLHSVAQYLTGAQLDDLLVTFHRLLKRDGLLIVGDIVPPGLTAPKAAVALLGFAAKNGFLLAAIGGLIRIALSDYLKLNKKVGLTHYSEEAMLTKLRAAGYIAARSETNIGHNPWRMTFLARRA